MKYMLGIDASKKKNTKFGTITNKIK